MDATNVRYCYFGRPKAGGRHKGILTMAIECLTDTKIRIGLACCCPKDNFCKRKGRLIAEGRAGCGKLGTGLHCSHLVDIDKDTKPVEAAMAYFNEKVDKATLPRWMKRWVLTDLSLAPGGSATLRY